MSSSVCLLVLCSSLSLPAVRARSLAQAARDRNANDPSLPPASQLLVANLSSFGSSTPAWNLDKRAPAVSQSTIPAAPELATLQADPNAESSTLSGVPKLTPDQAAQLVQSVRESTVRLACLDCQVSTALCTSSSDLSCTLRDVPVPCLQCATVVT